MKYIKFYGFFIAATSLMTSALIFSVSWIRNESEIIITLNEYGEQTIETILVVSAAVSIIIWGFIAFIRM